MAKQRPKRKRRVPTVKLDDMQKTTNDNLDTAVRSFEETTRVTQEIAKQMVDYSKDSIEQGSKTLEKLLTAKSPDKAFDAQTEYAKAAYESYVSHATKLGPALYRIGPRDVQVVPGFRREGDASKVIACSALLCDR